MLSGVQTMLRNVPLFSTLSESELRTVSEHAQRRSYAKNTILITEGDETDSLYCILSGKVKVFLSDEQGKEIILDSQEAGEHFGEIALLDENPRSASVMTTEPSELIVISKNDFRECIAKNPDIAINLIKELALRIRALTDNVKGLALYDVYGRTIRVLSKLAREQEDELAIPRKLTQQELANMVGASREMISRIQKDLKSGGYINIEDNKIVIKKKLPAGW